MATILSKNKFNLICVAHPDDETIFFGGLIQQRKPTDLPWMIVCVTSDGNPDRKRQFEEACRLLGVGETQWWEFPDRYEQRLEIPVLVAKLQALGQPETIYTHGIVGEYGHPHHQDVSYAVHKAFPAHPRLFSIAYNAFPENEVCLTAAEFETKAKILTKIYGSETSRFLNVLPSTFVEGFRRLEMTEVEAVYDFLARKKPLDESVLNAHRWLIDYLPRLRDLPRPF